MPAGSFMNISKERDSVFGRYASLEDPCGAALVMRHGVDVNHRPIGNPKRRYDEYSSKFSLRKKPRFVSPVGKSQTPKGDAC
jgi:hypothetical protein